MNDTNLKKKPIFDLSALNLQDFDDAILEEKNHEYQAGEKFIVFVLGDELFAVSSKQIAEVAQPLVVTPLMNVPDWINGIASLRGEIILVADLQRILGRKKTNLSAKAKFVIVRPPNSGAAAFAVDKLSEFIILSNDEIQKVSDENSPHIYGKAAYKSNSLQLIDLIKIFDSLEIA